MTSAKFDRRPFQGFNHLVDDLFTDLPVFIKNEFNSLGKKDSAPVNVKENDNSYLIEVAAPGFEKADFKINLDQQILTISAEKKNQVTEEGEKTIRREFSFESFSRSFNLGEEINPDTIEAKYENGVLKVYLPKKPVVKESAKQINVQ